MSCNTFWIQNIKSLFSTAQVIPLNSMNLNEQLNALTRLCIIIFIIMLLFDFEYSLPFLIVSLLFIIILYYIQKRAMKKYKTCQENYCNRPSKVTKLVPTDTSWYAKHDKKQNTYTIHHDVPQVWCNDQEPFQFNNPNWVSKNQRLVQGQNPKTLIKPVVVPPSHDLSFWKANNLITHSSVNSESQRESYLSGYEVSTCCGNLENKYVVPIDGPDYQIYIGDTGAEIKETKEGYQTPKPAQVINPMIPSIREGYTENYQTPKPAQVINPMIPSIREGYTENYQTPKPAQVINPMIPSIREGYEHKPPVYIAPNEPGWVNTTCGYNPKQVLESNLPSNYPAGNCEQDPNMAQYNKNLFTETIQPGVYSVNQVNEPINANIGISFQQQFEPVTCKRDETGVHYTEHDPRIIEPTENKPQEKAQIVPTEADVYDPRFNGYGTSYRAYNDPLLGQTRFAYDDVDAIRRPNYITRSKIDFLPYADSYGPMKPDQEYGNALTPDIRGLAQDSWLRNSLQFRDDLMKKQLRKTRANNWQNRIAPKYTMTMGNC